MKRYYYGPQVTYQGFIQDFELEGGETGWQQGDSGMRKHAHACPPSGKILNLDPLRLLLTQSGTTDLEHHILFVSL